jgi:hypothetical protein
MRRSDQYKPTAKTIVTQVRQTTVDAVRRRSTGMQDVATEVLDAALTQTDIVIGPDKPYTLRDVRQYLSIFTPSPIGLELVAFGEIPPVPERVEPSQFTTAKMEIEPVLAGQFINVAVFDPDLFGASVQVECFNVNSGETEYITLHCVRKNEYRGFIQSLNSATAGVNFDGTMYCKHNDILRFTFTDPHNESGLSQDLTQDVAVVSPVKATEMMIQRYVISGERLRVAIYDGSDAPFQSFTVLNNASGTAMDGALEPDVNDPTILVGSILLGTMDTGDELGVSSNDSLTITYANGHDATGLFQTVTSTATVKDPGTVLGEIKVAATTKIYGNLEIEVSDFDLFTTEVEVYVTNTRTNISKPVLLAEVWPGMSVFRSAVELGPEFGLPGDTLEITYSDYDESGTEVLTAQTVIASHVEHVDPVPEETPEPVDTGISKPVQLVVNGLFILNGSFAGSLKLYSLDENDVRCTLIKA